MGDETNTCEPEPQSSQSSPSSSSGSGPSTCASCGASADQQKAEKQAKIDAMTKDLGPTLKDNISKSPTMQDQLAKLYDDGYTVKVDPSLNDAAYTDNAAKQIVISPQDADGSTNGWGFAHEVGHATYHDTGGYTVPSMDGMTKDQWVNAATAGSMKDEGEATFNQYQFRNEVLSNGGKDVGGLGANYDNIYSDYSAGNLTQDQAATKMGNEYSNMTTSTTGQNYKTYYDQAWGKSWDAAHPAPPPTPPAQQQPEPDMNSYPWF